MHDPLVLPTSDKIHTNYLKRKISHLLGYLEQKCKKGENNILRLPNSKFFLDKKFQQNA